MILEILLAVFFFFINIFYLNLNSDLLYYTIYLMLILWILFLDRNIRFNTKYIFFYSVLLFNLFIVNIPAVFKSEMRYVAFLVMTAFLGPSIRSELFDKFRTTLFSAVLWLAVVMSVLSVVLIFLGVDTRPVSRPDYNGLFKHSMLYGPFAGLSSIFLIYQIINLRKTKIKRYFLLTLLILCLISVVISGSRIAIFSLVLVLVLVVLLNYKYFIFKHLKSTIMITSLFIVSYPIWSNKTENLMNKFEYAKEQDNLTASRTLIWLNRWNEFSSSPFWGVGFASVDTKKSANFDTATGKIEPGSSWLAILSMTGLIGFVSFINLFPRFNLLNPVLSSRRKMYLSVLFFYIVHMLAEGYIYSAGNGLFFLFWLTLGVLSIKEIDE